MQLNLMLLNMLVQIAIIAVVAVTSYLQIKRKMNVKKHCTLFRWLVPVQILTIVLFMLLPTINYVGAGGVSLLFKIEVIVHHTLGLIVVAIWIWVNLVQMRIIKHRGRLKNYMLTALAAWVLAFLIGLHIYAFLYL
jgi:hypothetical protein